MAQDSGVGKNATLRGTNQFMRQGHTAGPFGNDPNKDATGQVGAPPRELKP